MGLNPFIFDKSTNNLFYRTFGPIGGKIFEGPFWDLSSLKFSFENSPGLWGFVSTR